jgi:hypothetical protein
MKARQLSDRIGNMDDYFVQEAGQAGNYRKGRYNMLRKLVSIAAVVALMVCSGAVGAVAFSKETVVEVPVEQETLAMDDLGLILIFPDDWKDRYEVVQGNFEPNNSPMWTVCAKSVYDAEKTDEVGNRYTGMLFVVFRYADEPMSKEEFEASGIAGIGRYLLATERGTYAIMYATDIEFDPADSEAASEYNAMAAEMKDIRVVVDNALEN